MSAADAAALSPADEAFCAEVRDFYAKNLTPEFRRAGQMVTWAFSEFEYGRRWQKIVHSKGWGAPNWPVEYGGCDWTPLQRWIFDEETARAAPPAVMSMGRDLCAPCIMQFGTVAQKAEFLPKLLAGEDWWAQGYSEPGSGSDLASLQLKAESHTDGDGEHYVLNGSKIWTTYAQHANRIFALVRTASGAKKQHGISFLLMDMATPGIEVRPIINLAGEHEFNQVFFTNVRVPKSQRLGAENDGWTVARYLLSYEHGGSGGGSTIVGMLRRLNWLREIAALEPAGSNEGEGGRLIDDIDFARKLTEVGIAVEAGAFALEQVFAAQRQGAPPPATVPLIRIRIRQAMQRMTELAIEAVGYYGAVFQPQALRVAGAPAPVGPPHGVLAMPLYLSQRAATIAGGTPDIQRNNLTRSLLKL